MADYKIGVCLLVKLGRLFKKALLNKKALMITFFLITFLAFRIGVNAAPFNYDEFDFDKFAEENRYHWTYSCINVKSDDGTEKCIETTLQRQRLYYTSLYSLLAKYQREGLLIDDTIIIMTSFFELTPDLFNDEGQYYNALFGNGYNSYNIDKINDLKNYNINQDDSNLDFFAEEADTLKLLLKAMVNYPYTCYGSYGRPESTQTEEGSTVYSCTKGGSLMNGNECLAKADSGYMGFWEYLLSKNQSAVKTFFLGLKNDKEIECNELASKYPNGTKFEAGTKPEVSVEKYWEFLENSEYFDRKLHLQYRYARILKQLNHSSMRELTEEEYEAYDEEIKRVRKRIVDEIKGILDSYGYKNMFSLYNSASSDAYWWPIGGADITTDSSGKSYAVGEPVSTAITSPFGRRMHPVKKVMSMHTGVDIANKGGAGADNIIAAKDGVVAKVVSNCPNAGSSCGGGYGNFVKITHIDGNSTLYAHMHAGTVTVAEGESVKQGQVIGKIGNSGIGTGAHLHFEVIVGGIHVDPMQYISADTPRIAATGFSSEFEAMLVCFEGKGPDDGGNNYKVYDDGGGTLTVGPGITLKWDKKEFAAQGINVDNYNYVGALIPKSAVDAVYAQVIAGWRDEVLSVLARNNITLEQHQIDALTSRIYNTGNIKNFPDNYQKYGNTIALYDNYMQKPVTMQGISGTVPGMVKRRQHEWNLFHKGVYITTGCYS